jgi:hypothetical protein
MAKVLLPPRSLRNLAVLAQVYRLEPLTDVCGKAAAAGIRTANAKSFEAERDAVRQQIERALGCGHG